MNAPIYNCLISDNINDETGIYAISFVDCPANETDFITLAKDAQIHLNKDEKKQILTGVILRPEQLIYRYSENEGEYYIKFSADQIEKIARKMMRTNIALHNTTHQHQNPLTGNYLIELWIVEDPDNDKSNALGFKDLPKGTLMCSYKIENPEYWKDEVMTGNVKGFSLEGFFNQEISLSQIKNSPNKKNVIMNKKKKKESLLRKLGKFLLDIDAVESDDATKSGDPYVVFILDNGSEIYVDEDGFATLNDEQAPAGEHKLSDGMILVIDESGNFVETKEASTTTTDPDEATAAETLRRKQRLEKQAAKQKHKLEDESVTDTETIESLKAKIAELQSKIDELTKVADEAQTEVEELKKKSPSTNPATQREVRQDLSKMSHTDRMAEAAKLTMQQRKKK